MTQQLSSEDKESLDTLSKSIENIKPILKKIKASFVDTSVHRKFARAMIQTPAGGGC